MNAIVHIDTKQIPAHLRGSYTGRKFKAIATDTVHIPASSGLWDGGSRDVHYAIALEDGRRVQLSDTTSAPWDNTRRGQTITLKPGFAIVEHSIFCGKDFGLTFHIHPQNIQALLPASSGEIDPIETVVLMATTAFKSHYNGQDRYSMARSAMHWSRTRKGLTMSRDDWNDAKERLITRKLLNKAGAITNAGRNLIGHKEI